MTTTEREIFNEQFVLAYLATAEWADMDEANEGFNHEAKLRAILDCHAFINAVRNEFTPAEADAILNHNNEGLLAPHDFWLTRNGHGCGFWDGDWEWDSFGKDAGERLTKIAKSFKEVSLYKGDDNYLYFM